MPPQVFQARNGRVRLAYQVTGSGPVDVIRARNSGHLDIEWDWPRSAQFINAMSSFCRFIRFDRRGTGLSDRPTAPPTIDDMVGDIGTVLDAVGSDHAAVLGEWFMGPVAAHFAAAFPERTSALLLWATQATFVRSAEYPWGISAEKFERIETADDVEWPKQAFAQRWSGGDPAAIDWIQRLQRASSSPELGLLLIRSNYLVDARGVLPLVRARTLVLQPQADSAVPMEAAHDLARRAPHARIVEVPVSGQLIELHWEQVLPLIQEFLTGEHSAIETRELVTLCMLDIAGSTARATSVGDATWRDLLTTFYRTTRRELAAFGGTEIDTAGDGMLATFKTGSSAIKFARAIQEAARPLDLALRFGLHTGEVEMDSGRARGVAVAIAARLAASAEANEVLVSDTVRAVVEGAGFAFEELGARVLKGIPEPRQVLRVI